MTDAPTQSTTSDVLELAGELPWLPESVAAPLRDLDTQLATALGSAGESTPTADKILWDSLRLWGQGRVIQDLDLPPLQRGLWSLTDRESVRINAGLVSGALIGSRTLPTLVQELHRELTKSVGADVSCLTRALSKSYRDSLQIDALAKCNDMIVSLESEANEVQNGIERLEKDLAGIIEGQVDAARLLPMHEQLQSVMVPLARMTRVQKSGGVTAADRRKDMKVREIAQKLRMVIHEALAFRVRKDYDNFEKELMHFQVRSLEIGEELIAAQNALVVSYSRSDLEQAADSAINEFQELMARVSGSLAGDVPPYALARAPRIFPAVVDEYWQDIREKCPRLAAVRDGAGPPIVLLPGKGNTIHDLHSGRVVVSLFPLESRLASLEAALAESAFLADPELVESFAKVTRIPTKDRARLGEEFRRHIREFLKGTQDSTKAGVPRWMHNQLFRRP